MDVRGNMLSTNAGRALRARSTRPTLNFSYRREEEAKREEQEHSVWAPTVGHTSYVVIRSSSQQPNEVIKLLV